MQRYGCYSHAIVCRVPNSFKNAIGVRDKIDVDHAKIEHANYVQCLRNTGIDVIELEADERFPDCPFVEDTAIICNGQALITRPGHPLRFDEIQNIRHILRKEFNIPIIEITNPEARLDGSDVLFTGKEFFVGLSQRTNFIGANSVAKAFPEYATIPIVLPSNILHLKNVVTMAGPGIMCVGNSESAQKVLERIESEASCNYQYVKLPDDHAANCLYVNGCLIYRKEFPKSKQIFETEINFPKYSINMFNMCKPLAGLTNMVLLI